MTAPDLCTLASAAFPGITFEPIDFGRGHVRAQSPSVRVRCRPEVAGFMVTVSGQKADYTGTGNTILDAHADAVACRAEHERTRSFADIQTQGLLDL